MLTLPIHLQIIPHLPAAHIATVAVEAERLGYAGVWISDEGFMVEPFTALGLIASQTSRIGLGVITNPYTRHPAMTTAAIATLDQMSGGRAQLCYVAGGSLVLEPLGLSRPQPVETVQEAITITRKLLSSEKITWQGARFQLQAAQLEVAARSSLPIHVAGRGPKMIQMASQQADGLWIGLDDASMKTLAASRVAAGKRAVKIVCSDHPPLGTQIAETLSEAMSQDGTAGGPSLTPRTMAEWREMVQKRVADYAIDELLIVAWEKDVGAMLQMAQQVAEFVF